jgi:hypothetical protein
MSNPKKPHVELKKKQKSSKEESKIHYGVGKQSATIIQNVSYGKYGIASNTGQVNFVSDIKPTMKLNKPIKEESTKKSKKPLIIIAVCRGKNDFIFEKEVYEDGYYTAPGGWATFSSGGIMIRSEIKPSISVVSISRNGTSISNISKGNLTTWDSTSTLSIEGTDYTKHIDAILTEEEKNMKTENIINIF